LAGSKTGLLQGTLDLLILRAVSLGPNHGLGVARRVQQITRGTFDVKPGSLFPALHRLEEQGWLRSAWGESENRRRAKYYELTKAGRRQIETETAAWGRIAAAMAAAIAETS
jgi:PadR family transcriptional regulator PadR